MSSVGRDWTGVGMIGQNAAAGTSRKGDMYIASAAAVDSFGVDSSR